ncbi:MAG: hypothetical protein WCW17_00710 [Patescibacteria group bacterium]|jgi:hypothetical protein
MTYQKRNNNQTALGSFFVLIFQAIGLLFKFIFSEKKGKSGKTVSSIDKGMIRSKWEGLEHMVKLGGESNHKTAIIEADKILDHILKSMVSNAETMGERLKMARNYFSSEGYNAAWEAHKVRNRLAHESDFDLLHNRAIETMENYKQALSDLRVL